METVLHLMVLATSLVCVSSEKSVNVSHDGKDDDVCGLMKTPCATIRYAVYLHGNVSSLQVYINGSGGAYMTEASSHHLLIQHSLTLIGTTSSPAVIQCPDSNHSKLFQFAAAAEQPHSDPINVTFKNMVVRNCRGGGDDGVLELSNTYISLIDSQFTNNDMLLHHSQIAGDNCSVIDVTMNRCVLDNDVETDSTSSADRRLYQPAVLLAGCHAVSLTISSSQLTTAPVYVKALVDTVVTLDNVLLRGVSLRASSLDITLSPGSNVVTLNHCNMTGHHRSHASPLSINTDSSPNSSSVSLRHVHFYGNREQKTAGGAMSIFARFERETAAAARLNVALVDCSFINNSVDDTQVAGAVYVSNVDLVRFSRCEFESNTAREGGALYVYSSTDIQLDNDCVFRRNTARDDRQLRYASRGGGLFSTSSQLQITDTVFTENVAELSGSAVFSTDAISVSIIRSQFNESSEQSLRVPSNAILSLTARQRRTTSTLIKLTDSVVQSLLDSEHVMVMLSGQTSVSNNVITCQHSGLAVRYASRPALDYGVSYQLYELVVWSEPACPPHFYSALNQTESMLNASSVCYKCPQHADCDNAEVHAHYNYYAIARTDGRVDVELCPAGYCEPINTTGEQYCSEGRTGLLLCAGCDSHHVAALHFNNELSCQLPADCIDYSAGSVAVTLFTLIYVACLILLLCLCTRHQPDQPSSSASTSHVTASRSVIGCVFSVVFFYQLLPSVHARLLRSAYWWDRLIQLCTSIFHMYPAAFSAGRGFCLRQLTVDDSSVSAERYFLTMSIYWSQLALIVLLFAVLAGVFLLCRGPFTEQNIKMLLTYFLSAFIFFQIFSNVPILRASLQSVHCLTLNDSCVLYSETATSCYASWQIFTLIYIIFSVLPLCLVIDTAAFLLSRGHLSVFTYLSVCLLPLVGVVYVPAKKLLTRSRDQQLRDEFEVDETTPPGLRSVSAHSIVIIQTVLIKPFNSYFASTLVDIGWMTVLLIRNSLICLLASLLEHDPATRSLLVSVICLLFTVDQVVSSPYRHRADNHVHTSTSVLLSLLAVIDVYASVIYQSSDLHNDVVDWIARFIISLPIVLLLLLLVAAVIRRAVRCRRPRPL